MKKKIGHKQLWPLVSKYIRKRDKGKCQTCGRKCESSQYHAGHGDPSSVCGYALRYHPYNLMGQCFQCNITRNGWGTRFKEVQIERWGEDTVRELVKLRHKQYKINWNEAIEYYKDPPIAHTIVLPFVTEV